MQNEEAPLHCRSISVCFCPSIVSLLLDVEIARSSTFGSELQVAPSNALLTCAVCALRLVALGVLNPVVVIVGPFSRVHDGYAVPHNEKQRRKQMTQVRKQMTQVRKSRKSGRNFLAESVGYYRLRSHLSQSSFPCLLLRCSGEAGGSAGGQQKHRS
jgi:hypothetical protein